MAELVHIQVTGVNLSTDLAKYLTKLAADPTRPVKMETISMSGETFEDVKHLRPDEVLNLNFIQITGSR